MSPKRCRGKNRNIKFVWDMRACYSSHSWESSYISWSPYVSGRENFKEHSSIGRKCPYPTHSQPMEEKRWVNMWGRWLRIEWRYYNEHWAKTFEQCVSGQCGPTYPYKIFKQCLLAQCWLMSHKMLEQYFWGQWSFTILVNVHSPDYGAMFVGPMLGDVPSHDVGTMFVINRWLGKTSDHCTFYIEEMMAFYFAEYL